MMFATMSFSLRCAHHARFLSGMIRLTSPPPSPLFAILHQFSTNSRHDINGDTANGPQSSTSPPISNEQHRTGFFATLMDRYSIRGQQRRFLLAERLFRAAQRRALDPLWHTHGQVDTAFRPRHSLLTLHVWFLHRRLLLGANYQPNALLLQEELFEILWHDTQSRIRAVGIQELMVNKHLKDVQNVSFQMCLALDHATEVRDEKRRRDDMGLILWTHVYLSNEDVDDETVDKMAHYVMGQFDNVCFDLPDEYWLEGRIGWVPIPNFGQRKCKLEDVQEVLPTGWLTALTNAGEKYYWNENTMKSSWDRNQLN